MIGRIRWGQVINQMTSAEVAIEECRGVDEADTVVFKLTIDFSTIADLYD